MKVANDIDKIIKYLFQGIAFDFPPSKLKTGSGEQVFFVNSFFIGALENSFDNYIHDWKNSIVCSKGDLAIPECRSMECFLFSVYR